MGIWTVLYMPFFFGYGTLYLDMERKRSDSAAPCQRHLLVQERNISHCIHGYNLYTYNAIASLIHCWPKSSNPNKITPEPFHSFAPSQPTQYPIHFCSFLYRMQVYTKIKHSIPPPIRIIKKRKSLPQSILPPLGWWRPILQKQLNIPPHMTIPQQLSTQRLIAYSIPLPQCNRQFEQYSPSQIRIDLQVRLNLLQVRYCLFGSGCFFFDFDKAAWISVMCCFSRRLFIPRRS